MIRKFYARSLDALDRLYDIDGGVSRVDRIALDPVQLVHDVSREAEAAQGFQTIVPIVITTGGAGARAFGSVAYAAILQQADVVNKLQTRGLEAVEVDIWILGWHAVVTAATVADFANISAGANFGNTVGGGVNRMFQLFDNGGAPLVSGGANFVRSSDNRDPAQFGALTLPVLLPRDDTSSLLAAAQDDATGAITATAFFTLWISPAGTFPPSA